MTEEAATRRERILVVDDVLENRMLVEANLGAEGFDVILAEGGQQALDAFSSEPADMVLLDISMPRMDGFETCRRLRGCPGGADVPIAFLTAMNDLKNHRQAMESGADDFLTKPIQRAELLLRVRSLLRVRRLTERLKAERDELVRVQRQKDDLIAFLVHDLKSPLTTIIANLEYIEEVSSFSENAGEALRDTFVAVSSMNRMVLDLLDVRKAEDGALCVAAAELDLGALANEVFTGAKRRASMRNHRVVMSLACQRERVHADRNLLRRLLDNLIDNSFKYTPAGGTIGIEASSDNSHLELRVRDEGPGIPDAYKKIVFDKYVQLNPSAHAHARSSRGLGLVFCRMVAEAHGGTIWVEDNHPKGSLFRVKLPV
ncbi:MAG: hybrid sensor histidine kinase/response regulator [Deltaproteobacteria bacterium]|nr:hybrid sensor histidine kinase/response regulator [Deltaproteobacteria bacterium]